MILTDADQLREALRLAVQERDAAQQRELEGMRERTALAREVESLRQQLEAAEAFHAVAVVEREAARAQAHTRALELEEALAEVERLRAWISLHDRNVDCSSSSVPCVVQAPCKRHLWETEMHARCSTVAERQREACAVTVEKNIDDPTLRKALAEDVRDTQLVTEVDK